VIAPGSSGGVSLATPAHPAVGVSLSSAFSDRITFTMGQAAELLDVRQAFLRRLEAHELVQPERSGGNQRRYTRSDLERVSHICELVDEGITLSGVRRVLELEDEVRMLKAEMKRLKHRDAGR
jgi:MerR family transcriptional regulator, heat shock protein HspR